MQNDAEVRSEAQQKVICFQNLYNKMISPICMQMELTTSKKSQAKTIFLCLWQEKEVPGDFIKSDLIASNVINSNMVVLTYRSTYTHYSLVEEFTLTRKDDSDKLRLGTYFINDGGKRGKVIRL